MSPFVDFAINLIPFSLIAAVVWLLVRPTFLRRLLSRLREKKIYQKERVHLGNTPPPYFALPYVVLVWCFFFALGIAFRPLTAFGGELRELADYRNVGIIPLVVAAIFIHLRPNHSRELKYTLVLGPLPSVGLLLLGSQIRDQSIAFDAANISWNVVVLILSLWWFFAFIAISLSIPYLVRTWGNARSTGRENQLYFFSFVRRRLFGPLVALCVIFSPDVAIVLLGGRYVLVEAFRRHPIVYLRSFRHEQTTITLAVQSRRRLLRSASSEHWCMAARVAALSFPAHRSGSLGSWQRCRMMHGKAGS